MMSLPFFLFAGALVAVFRGRRSIAIGLWGLSVIVMLILFRLHATDQLHIGL
jgi:predicted membrane metal-binding protein